MTHRASPERQSLVTSESRALGQDRTGALVGPPTAVDSRRARRSTRLPVAFNASAMSLPSRQGEGLPTRREDELSSRELNEHRRAPNPPAAAQPYHAGSGSLARPHASVSCRLSLDSWL